MYLFYSIIFIRTVIVTFVITIAITIANIITIIIVCISPISNQICFYLIVILKLTLDCNKSLE